MNALSRSLIAFFSAIAILLTAGFATTAHAAKSGSRASLVDTDIAEIGFLNLKTFMVVPVDEDGEWGRASEHMRVISPETIFARRPRIDMLKTIIGGESGSFPHDSAFSTVGPDSDSMTVNINGQPLTLSLGLKEAIARDIEMNIRTYGTPGLFNGVTGFASAAYLGAATNDLLGKIDTLESIGSNPLAQDPKFPTRKSVMMTGPVYVIPTPSTLSFFVVGLAFVGWLRRAQRIEARQS